MNFALTDRQAHFRNKVRDFMEEHVRPKAAENLSPTDRMRCTAAPLRVPNSHAMRSTRHRGRSSTEHGIRS
jgi:alkylation response protein AidB-like acyl-CoA dehydrogenase